MSFRIAIEIALVLLILGLEVHSLVVRVTAPPTACVTAAFKPVFFVASISRLRGVVEPLGGVMEAAEHTG